MQYTSTNRPMVLTTPFGPNALLVAGMQGHEGISELYHFRPDLRIDKKTPVRKTRPCITHSNFMSKEAVERCARLGVVVDIQPAWLYLDTRTLTAQFGYDRLRYFQPLKSLFEAGVIAGGGSDHMQKIGSLRSINPYNPFLGMWVTITRVTGRSHTASRRSLAHASTASSHSMPVSTMVQPSCSAISQTLM